MRKTAMRKFFLSLYFLIAAWSTIASAYKQANKPIVLWHGMGDTCCNPESMGRLKDLIQRLLPGTFVHSIQVGEGSQEDHEAGFFGQVNKQIDLVCEQLASIPELAEGFNGVGFSQGGLFLRGYVQRCNRPAVHRLITFGSPHGGVTDIPNCMNPSDLTCRLMRSMVRYGAYSGYVQHRVIQAQYFKDPRNIQGYLERNIFLPNINNELQDARNTTYRDNLAALDAFVMVRFADDAMVKPGETAWFWTYAEDGVLVPLVNQTLYKEDWLGLRKLGGRLKFLVSPGQHMQISDEFFEAQIVWPYLAADSHGNHYDTDDSSNIIIISSNDSSICISGSGTAATSSDSAASVAATPPRLVYQQEQK
ncbi:Alpha/Beta hydrolase protein [Zychaea mexicana]|uniref:Alpha/Beta hydrolase protein n=1 Tax=Zychaea mexicana TaxID=64656 RepID=UPI0022FE2829|nr:Alpha/Beta hydrolase protein [Zychaea mexicana]KAI9488597.1 Alpha/Beta hydrolase protein [Zychaea mexicana]